MPVNLGGGSNKGVSIDLDALPAAPARFGVAISGGGDSVALAHMAAEAAPGRIELVTVDHGLRDVAAELDLVARHAADLGVPHHVLRWHWDGRGNLQAEARNARRELIADWAKGRGIGAVLLGHSHDDQAETVLMRIARGSGIDGLAGMSATLTREGIDWHRPLLGFGREELRDYLRARQLDWAEDPSNEDERFDRVRVRKLLATLGPLGLSPDRLVQLSDHAAAAQTSLKLAARNWVAQQVSAAAGALILPGACVSLRSDTDRRVLSAAVQYIGGGDYRPRWKSLQGACARLANEGRAPIAGCVLETCGGQVFIYPDPASYRSAQDRGALVQRWSFAGPPLRAAKFAPLGNGRHLIPGAMMQDVPMPALRASPAIWDGESLLGAPFLGYGPWSVLKPARIMADFTEMFDIR